MPYVHNTDKVGSTRFHELLQTGRTDVGIFKVNVCERGFIINSEAAMIGSGTALGIMQGQSNEEIAAAFETDPTARLSAMNDILMVPWANRMMGPVVNGKVEVEFMGQYRYVPVNLDPYRLHGLAYANEYHDISIYEGHLDGIAITGTTEIWRDQWFSDLSIMHTIELTNGSMTRSVEVTNIGERPAPVSVGEHPYFRIPDNQSRAEVVLQIPGRSTILLGEDSNPDFSRNPVIPIEDSPFAALAAGGKLMDTNLNHSFILGTTAGLAGVEVEAGVIFDAARYGVFISTNSNHDNSVNVFHGFAPLGSSHPADGKAVALEFQGNLLDPLGIQWKRFSPLAFGPHLHPSGMRILNPGESMRWYVTHSARQIG